MCNEHPKLGPTHPQNKIQPLGAQFGPMAQRGGPFRDPTKKNLRERHLAHLLLLLLLLLLGETATAGKGWENKHISSA